MSDEEAYDENGDEDYEEAGTEDDPINAAEPEDPSDEEELGLDEEAAGTDESEDEEEGSADEAEQEGALVTSASKAARPEKTKIDPFLRASNKPGIVIVITGDDRTTDNRLHKTEAALVLAMRAKQIADYGTSFTSTGDLHDPVAIAMKELYDKKCPLKLRREVGLPGPQGEIYVEEWVVREMSLPPLSSLSGTV
jgi:DNA-directed RNA polymerases I, II, and III subunit RPABC2